MSFTCGFFIILSLVCGLETRCSPTTFYKNCWIRRFPGLFIDIDESQRRGAQLLRFYPEETALKCSRSCCLTRNFSCNLAVFHYDTVPESVNCFHLLCPTLESCVLRRRNNVILYNVTKGVDPDLLVFGKYFTSNVRVWPQLSSKLNATEPFASDKRHFNRPAIVPVLSLTPAPTMRATMGRPPTSRRTTTEATSTRTSTAGPPTARATSTRTSTAGPPTARATSTRTSTAGPPTARATSTRTSTAWPPTARATSTRTSTAGPPTARATSTRTSTAGPPTARPTSTRTSTAGPPTARPTSTRTSTAGPPTARATSTRTSMAWPPTARPTSTRTSTAGPPTARPASTTVSTSGPPTARATSTPAFIKVTSTAMSTSGPPTARSTTPGESSQPQIPNQVNRSSPSPNAPTTSPVETSAPNTTATFSTLVTSGHLPSPSESSTAPSYSATALQITTTASVSTTPYPVIAVPANLEGSKQHPNDTKGYANRNHTGGEGVGAREGEEEGEGKGEESGEGPGDLTPVWHLAAKTLLVPVVMCVAALLACCCTILMAVCMRCKRKGRYRTSWRNGRVSMRLIKYVIVRESS